MKTKKCEAAAPPDSDEPPIPPAAASAGMSTDRLLTRGEAAEILGTSTSSVRRLEQTSLAPVVDERGVHLHSEKRVLELKIQRSHEKGSSDGFDGVLASAAFEMFDDGAGPVDVVRQLKIGPDVARDLYREWADLRGGFAVSGAAAAKLQRLAWTCDDLDLRSGDDLVAFFEQFEKNECSCCERRTPRLCLHCYSARPARAQKLVAAAAAVANSRRQSRELKSLEKEVVERARQRIVLGGTSADEDV